MVNETERQNDKNTLRNTPEEYSWVSAGRVTAAILWVGVIIGMLWISLLSMAPMVQAQAFPAGFELVDLLAANGGDGSQGFVLNGGNVSDFSGSQVAGSLFI